ncbi:MAG: spore coat U domain-containing protein [Parvibaculum sp.]|uniref:Csu type fimbrial protein n=1 Tax=Parvibaculum sp. TaxID=2024848 RepID=UPI002720026C|nr:spore coat U domain-containing protein [Parvibaculum sp.]MDO8838569.1 spore coat U domain-containing protein [Parvibaculum sp.]
MKPRTSKSIGLLCLVAFIALAGAVLMPSRADASCLGIYCTCTVSATGHNFGTYDAIQRNAVTSSNTVTVRCVALVLSVAVSYEIRLSSGSSGSYNQRQMMSGANTLGYNLYTNSSRTTVWGDGTGGTQTVTDGYLLQLLFPVTRNYTVYGRIDGGQNAAAGSYSDVITVTVLY